MNNKQKLFAAYWDANASRLPTLAKRGWNMASAVQAQTVIKGTPLSQAWFGFTPTVSTSDAIASAMALLKRAWIKNSSAESQVHRMLGQVLAERDDGRAADRLAEAIRTGYQTDADAMLAASELFVRYKIADPIGFALGEVAP